MAEAMVACFEIDLHTQHEDRVFTKPPAAGEIYLTKTVKDILIIERFLDLWPELYVICMIRDPRDAVVSRHGKDPERYWAGLRYWNAYIPYWRGVGAHPRFITVRYEDFVSHPDTTQDLLSARVPFLRKRAPFSRYHEVAEPSAKSLKALGSVRPIAPDGVGNWRRHPARVAGQLQLHGPIADDLIEFGYEDDDSWLRDLDGVDPDVTSSHWPEYFTRTGIWRRKLPAYPRIILERSRRAFMPRD
jgi:hypothetical protein